MYDPYWEEPNEYEQAIESLKDSLRESVREEIAQQIEKLTTENRELKLRLTGLDQLEAEASREKLKYERELANVKSTAYREVHREGLGKLLRAIDERLYTVERVYTKRDKCDKCDDNRRVRYQTPRGRDAFEPCECAEQDWEWEPVETAAHEVSRREGKLTIWWVSSRRWSERDEISPTVLTPAATALAADVLRNPTSFSFPTAAAAQATADALNRGSSE